MGATSIGGDPLETKSELIRKLEEQIAALPVGYIVYKTIKGKKQPYLQHTENGKTVSQYSELLGNKLPSFLLQPPLPG